jgi:SAM-dependent methyltransferase
MDDLKINQDFWRCSHDPRRYLNASHERTDALVTAIQALNVECPAILEIGCNAGRNLFGLWDAGYRDLTGIEINPAAIRCMREARPECIINAVPHAVEDVIRQMPTDYYDVVFTMAVLMHLHPKSNWVLGEMVRTCAHYIMTIEHETSCRFDGQGIQRHFPRPYSGIFRSLGMAELRHQKGVGDLSAFTLRVFEKLGTI